MVGTKANDCHTIGGFYGVNGKKLQRQNKDHLSDFKEWEQKGHAKQWLIFPENMGPYLSIDETALSKGELYTIITDKRAKGKKGSIVAIFSGTKVEPIIEQLLKVPAKKRGMVREITLDMANSMKIIAKKCFPKAIRVTDRFHVQKLALEALQDIRIKQTQMGGHRPGERTDKTGKGKEQNVHSKRIRQRGHKKTTIGQKQVPALQGPQ